MEVGGPNCRFRGAKRAHLGRMTFFANRAGKRFVVHADEILTAFLELESAIYPCAELPACT